MYNWNCVGFELFFFFPDIIRIQKQLKDLQMKHIAQVFMLEEKLFALQEEKQEAEANNKDLGEEMAKMCTQIEDLWKQVESLQVCLLLSLHVVCVCTSIHCHCVLHTHNHIQYQ